jgi:hypothetical protein
LQEFSDGKKDFVFNIYSIAPGFWRCLFGISDKIVEIEQLGADEKL